MSRNIFGLFAAVLFAMGLVSCGGGNEGGSAMHPKAMQTNAPQYSTDDLYQFFAIAFNAAPGVTYMGQLLEAANYGLTIKEIVNIFTTKEQFTSVYPITLTNVEFAARLVANVVGNSATAQAKQTAVNDIVAALALPDWSRGDVIFAVFTNLANKLPTDPDWAGTSAKMKNQVVYAKYYTEVMKGDTTTLVTLQKVIASVTENSDISGGIEQAILLALAPAPTVTVSLSQSKATVGSPVTMTWTSTNAVSCTGVDSMIAGSQPTSGSIVLTPSVGGKFTYTISCASAGGSASGSSLLIVPIPVYPTSNQNAKLVNMPPTILPTTQGSSWPGFQDWRARAYADFEQNGTLSYFFHDVGNSPTNMFQSGQIHFVRFNSDRSYTEITDQLIENPQDGCIWALKALVADFNGDGKPDIFVGCTGPDYLVPVGMAGENSLLLLSQPSGKYRISRPNFGVAGQNANHTYFHSVTAADINGDGAPDIVVADITENDHGRSPVYALVNDGTGNFIKQSVGFDFLFTAGVWFVELLEVNRDGHLSLFIGGAAPRSGAFYKLAGPLNFEQFPFLTLPMHPRYSLDLDIVAKDGSVYVLSVPSDYLGTVVVKYTLASGLESTIWETRPDSGALYIADPETCGGTGGEWVEWFRIFENKIVTDDLCRTPNIPIGN